MSQPLINGQAYAWSQIKCNILGLQIQGISSINYNENQEMQDNYGAGNRPVSRGYGKIETTASVTLHMEEIEALQGASTTGRLQDIPEFDIVISYLPENGNIVNHTLKNVRFKSNGREISEGDMMIESELELQVSHIKWR